MFRVQGLGFGLRVFRVQGLGFGGVSFSSLSPSFIVLSRSLSLSCSLAASQHLHSCTYMYMPVCVYIIYIYIMCIFCGEYRHMCCCARLYAVSCMSAM